MFKQALFTLLCSVQFAAAHAATTPAWTYELGLGIRGGDAGPFEARMHQLGYSSSEFFPDGALNLAVGRRLNGTFTVLLNYQSLASGDFFADSEHDSVRYTYSGHGLSGEVRMRYDSRLFAPYLQAGVGTAVREDHLDATRFDWGLLLSAGGGIQIIPRSTVGVGIHVSRQATFGLASGFGDRHELGGTAVALELRVTP